MRDTQGFWAPQPVASIRYCTGTIHRDFTCVSLLSFPSLHFQHFSENIQYSIHSLIPKPRLTHQNIPNTPSPLPSLFYSRACPPTRALHRSRKPGWTSRLTPVEWAGRGRRSGGVSCTVSQGTWFTRPPYPGCLPRIPSTTLEVPFSTHGRERIWVFKERWEAK